jgi:FtsP/CotA-like multicopper oxidase with cupredoxin domain
MNQIAWMFLAVAVGAGATALAAPLPGGTLDPLTIPKYVEPLVIPPRMPAALSPTNGAPIPNTYDVAARQFQQQVLPPPLPPTTVWGYGAVDFPDSFSYPGHTFESTQGVPTTVTWRNELFDAAGNFIPPLFSVDQTLHWANPVMACIDGSMMTDCRGFDPTPYGGPVPIVTHLHGAHVEPVSDGYPEAWYLPPAANIPLGFATEGSNYGSALPSAPGQATFVYRNDQRATALWYHDHALGMTRTNIYAGLSGFYLHRDAYEASLGLPGPYGAYELPLVIQDRSFNSDGSLFYPASRAFFDGFTGPYIPTPGSDVSPIWNPEFFGNTMVVNGRTWPRLAVEPRKYRFRILNGSDSRTVVLQFAPPRSQQRRVPVAFSVIGNDGGFLTGAPVKVSQLVVAPAERYDVIVDFQLLAPGTRLILGNVGPDSPFGGGMTPPGKASDPATTGQVMAFDVVPLKAPDTSQLPQTLNPPPDPYGVPARVASVFRPLTLTEFESAITPGPREAQLGDGFGPLPWMAPVSEQPRAGATEEWGIVNTTEDAHPIHIHQVQFRIAQRVALDMKAYSAALAACPRPAAGASPAAACPPDPRDFVALGAKPAPAAPWEVGQKDTVLSNPGELLTLQARFDLPGLYVWHCHIVSHEDNGMMRPICVTDATHPGCVQ